MSTEFLRLKRKHTVWRVLRSLMVGSSLGMVLTGIMLLIFKLTSTNGRAPLCIGLGAAVAFVMVVVTWLLMRRSDLRAAEMIDSQHKLRERVQTMIAFRNEEGAMVQMQRQDTEEKLLAVKSYDIKAGKVVLHVFALLLAFAVCITGVIVPARAEVEPPVYIEPNYDATPWQVASLEALITHVEASNMAEPAKAQTVAELQTLLEALKSTITVSAFKAQVIQTIANVYAYADAVNSNDDIHDVVASVDHDIIDLLAYVVGGLNNAQFGADVEEVGYQLGQSYNLPTLGALSDSLAVQLALIPVTYIPDNAYTEEDSLYQAMLILADGLKEVSALVEAEATEEEISNRLGEVIYAFKSEAHIGLERQTATKNECIYVVESLCSIFGITPVECPPDPDPVYSKKVDDDEFTDVEGAPGSGEMQYAGDEQVFDYKKNEHVSYTELVAEYYAMMLNAQKEGKISQEMAEFILKYFSQLYTG